MAFSRAYTSREEFVIPTERAETSEDLTSWPKIAKKSNPSGRGYLVGVIYQDFIDCRDYTYERNLKLAGFSFKKVLAIRTRFPFHQFTLKLLNSFASIKKIK